MPLSQQEILEARQKAGVPAQGYGSLNALPSGPAVGGATSGGGDWWEQIKQQRAAVAPKPESPLKAHGVLGAFQDVAQGAAKSGTETILDIGHLGQKIQGVVGKGLDKVTGDKYGFEQDSHEGVFAPESAAGQKIREGQKPTNTAQRIGGGIEKLAELAIPIGGAPAKTILGKAAQGAAIGGGLGGAHAVAKDESLGDVTKDTAIGAAAGGALGLAGGVIGKVLTPKSPADKLKYVTPTSRDIPEKEFKNLLDQGRISPKSLTKPAQYIMSPSEKEVALKYHEVLDKEPVNTSINIGNKIGELDGDVGKFLEENNSIYNRGELRNHLDDALDDLDDITIPKERIAEAKKDLVNRFVESVKKGDMKTLWETRKEFDQQIDSAFRGSPTLQKEMKIRLRGAVQEFVAERTPEGVYKGFMHDMTNLFDLRDVADVKAAKGRGLDAMRQWVKDNPKTAKILGLTVGALGLGIIGGGVVHAGGGGE